MSIGTGRAKLHSGYPTKFPNRRPEVAFFTGLKLAISRLFMPFGKRIELPYHRRTSPLRRIEGALNQMEIALHKMQASSSLLADCLPCGIVTCNSAGILMGFNPVAEKLLGHGVRELVGRSIQEAGDSLRSPVLDGLLKLISDTLLSGREHTDEELGSNRHLSVTTRSIRNLKGEIATVVATIMDVTEQKCLKDLICSMERLASFGEIAAGMTHELRSPLASIKGLAQVLELGTTDRETERRYLRTIVSEIDRLDCLLTGLLDWAKPGPQDYCLERMEKAVDDVILLTSAKAKLQGVRVVHKVKGNPPPIMINVKTVKQALLNLIINALQAMPQGGELIITTRATPSHVRVSVADTGPGIPPEVLPHIFEPFFTTRKTGTGLGLWMVHEVVHDHGGRLRMRSKPGRGACFIIELPIELETPKRPLHH